MLICQTVFRFNSIHHFSRKNTTETDSKFSSATCLPAWAWSVWLLIPTLNPVGHQSTKWILCWPLILAMAALTFLGFTSPRYNIQHDMYFPCFGSHFTIWFCGSKTAFVISCVSSPEWWALFTDKIGAKLANGKWIRGYGTRLVWNSFKSTFSSPTHHKKRNNKKYNTENDLSL